jgi:hypothetical protein
MMPLLCLVLLVLKFLGGDPPCIHQSEGNLVEIIGLVVLLPYLVEIMVVVLVGEDVGDG